MPNEPKDLTQQVAALGERVDKLAADLRTLNDEVRGGQRATHIIKKDRAQEVLNPDQFNRPEVIPPATQEDAALSIVGGEETSDFPDCCAVGNDVGYYCTGTLIAPNVVVTAAHCTGATRVFLGGSNIRVPEDGETIAVSRRITHPDTDLQVFVLESDSTVTPRHVAQGAEVGNPDTAMVVGFGTTNFAGTVGYGKKRMVEVPITSLDCGTQAEENDFGCNRGTTLVAGHRGLLKDTCRGDSGGPLYIRSPEGTFYLLGVTSRGIINSNLMCGNGGVYVRADVFLDWIRQETGVDIEGPLN